MVKITLVDIIRDVEPRLNTLVTLEELQHLGLDIIVVRDGVPTVLDHEHNAVSPVHGITLIDSFFVSNYPLGEHADDTLLKEKRETAGREWSSAELGGSYSDKKWDGYRKKERAYEKAKAEFSAFRPTVLTQKLKEADVVVAPRDLAEKIKREIPDAYVAVMEDARGPFELFVPATGSNPARVLIRPFSTNHFVEESKVDYLTTHILFNSQISELGDDYSFANVMRRMDSDVLDRRFYQGVWFNQDDVTNPVHTSTIKINALVKRSRRSIFDIDDLGIDDEEAQRLIEAGISGAKVEFDIPANNYGLGAKLHGYRGIGANNNFLKDKRAEKVKTIKKMYESLWTTPLDSVQEIRDRQALIGRLVEDDSYFAAASSLGSVINKMVEPYLHLSSLSKLLSANVLGSRWGSRIHKKPFYDDFMNIARQFISLYDNFAAQLGHLNPDSREMKVMLGPLRKMSEQDDELGRVYCFVRHVLGAQPKDFYELRKLFAEELKKRGAKKIPELETYNPAKDTDIPFEERGDMHLAREALGKYDPLTDSSLGEVPREILERLRDPAKRSKYSGYNPIKDKNLRDIDREILQRLWDNLTRLKSMAFNRESRRSPLLEEMLKEFHAQGPIAADDAMKYLDYVGSRLAAYNAMGHFIRAEKANWTRPEILEPELGVVDIRGGWYPLTSVSHGGKIVANDTYLDVNERIEIEEGTNAGGKTVDARKTAFIVATAMSGLYVPAQSARISFFDRIRFRLKRTGMHNTGAMRSELSDLGSMLNGLGKYIFVGLDESFTSTNPEEGEALTYGLIRRLSSDPKVRGVITIHYPSLRDILTDDSITGVKFSHFKFSRYNRDIVFSYKKNPGINTQGDYAIPIAENQKVSPAIIAYAKEHARSK